MPAPLSIIHAKTQRRQEKRRSFRGWLHCVLLIAGFWLCSLPAWAEQRFPPPDFESGHQLPVTATPPARAGLWEGIDAVALVAALGVALWLVYRSRSRRGIVALSLCSLAYFGFYRKGCVCAIGSVQNVALALCDPHYALPVSVLVFFLAPLVVALFAGRAFCAAVCPQGALQDVMLLKPVRVPFWLEQALGVIPYLFLGAGVIFAATGNGFLICRYDPLVPFFRFGGSATMLALGAAFLLAGIFVGRPYCRFLCPYGALLRLATAAAKWRVRVTPDACTQCALCRQSCPFGAMREPADAAALSGSPRALAAARRRLATLLLLLPVLMAGMAWGGSHLAAALEICPRTTPGGWLLGGWAGLVIGGKLIALCLHRRRTDFEPEPAACFACARCFEDCPAERTRRGLAPLPPAPPAEPPPAA